MYGGSKSIYAMGKGAASSTGCKFKVATALRVTSFEQCHTQVCMANAETTV